LKDARPKVVMLGLRGLPNVQGGVEKHVEALAPRLLAHDIEVDVIGRRPYLPTAAPYEWKGVRVFPLPAPRSKSFETIVHTLLGVLEAKRRGADILHIHAIGPALWTPLARLLGLRVVVTHHGYDYDRGKWNGFAKLMLRLGERFGMTFANGRIAVSAGVAATMRQRYGAPVAFVPNGVEIGDAPAPAAVLDRFGLVPRQYIVTVGRLVPEKRQLDLIGAYSELKAPHIKLVIVGASDHPDAYVRQLEAAAAATPGVVMTGLQTGAALAELFANARLFVLPSSHEGMPIALLEALGYGLPVLASDIDANIELSLPAADYFPLGDRKALADAIRRQLDEPMSQSRAAEQRRRVLRDFAWDSVAEQTVAIYRDVLRRGERAQQLSVRSESRS
jgi:glycosyltransferase involved in cell wall biosynthesis